MRQNQVLTLAAAVVMMVGTASQAHATATTNRATATLTFLRQGDTVHVPNSTVEIYKLKKNLILTKNLLGLLATATGNPNVSAAANYLEVDGDVDNSPAVLVKSSTGAVVAHVTAFFTLSLDSLDVYSSVYNSANDAETSTDYFLITLGFHDNAGNDFSVSGMATDRYAASAYKNGQQTQTSVVTANVSGKGHIANEEGIVYGSIRLTGRSIAR
jgi:hypothetical protein